MGSKGSDTQTVKNEPWSGVQEPLKNLYSKTQSALGNILPYYPGQTFANLTPLQESGMQGNLNYAQNYYSPAAMGYNQQLGQYMDAPLNISQDPAVQSMMAANQSQVQDWLTKSALPTVRQGAVGAGQYGSSRQGIAEGNAIGDAAKALSNANAQTMLGAYGTASDLAGRAAGLMPAGLAMGFTPGQMAQQYGGVYQGQEQKAIDEAIKRFAYPEESLWNKLGQAGALYTGGGYSNQTSQMPGSSPLAGAIGGAMGGSALSSALGFAGPWGALIGAGLGLLG